jgi:hypothetical protein
MILLIKERALALKGLTYADNLVYFMFREEPSASILQQHHGQLLRWVEERRSRHEVNIN